MAKKKSKYIVPPTPPLVEKDNTKISLWIKIFFIGILLQFFFHTLFTFQLGLTGNFWNGVWLWKEVIIMIGFYYMVYLLVVAFQSYKKQHFHTPTLISFIKQLPLKTYSSVFVITLVAILGVSLITSNLVNYIISIRYSFIGFFIFIVVSYLGYFAIKTKNLNILLIRYRKLMKMLLVVGLFWWGLVWLMPNGLKFFGYDKFSHEGEVGERPPTVYYTDYNKGLVRNQFIFERPISYGFFLVALWPLFVILAIRKKHIRELLWWGSIYGLNIFSTFSRAAWGAWVIQTAILLFIIYHKEWKKMFLYFLLPALLGIGVVSYFAADHITNRQFSNTGHLKEIKIALEKIQTHPLLGDGVGSAGPASHQIKEFEPYNTENQYLQVWVEYGIFGLLGRSYLYFFFLYLGYLAWKNSRKDTENSIKEQLNFWLIGLALGIVGLSIENLVLHAFVDRMIVYPFMLLFGFCYGVWLREHQSEK